MTGDEAGAARVLVTAATLVVVSGVLGTAGWYGWRNPHQLVHPSLDEDARWRRERTMRRGAALCLLVAALLPPLLAVALVAR